MYWHGIDREKYFADISRVITFNDILNLYDKL